MPELRVPSKIIEKCGFIHECLLNECFSAAGSTLRYIKTAKKTAKHAKQFSNATRLFSCKYGARRHRSQDAACTRLETISIAAAAAAAASAVEVSAARGQTSACNVSCYLLCKPMRYCSIPRESSRPFAASTNKHGCKVWVSTKSPPLRLQLQAPHRTYRAAACAGPRLCSASDRKEQRQLQQAAHSTG